MIPLWELGVLIRACGFQDVGFWDYGSGFEVSGFGDVAIQDLDLRFVV